MQITLIAIGQRMPSWVISATDEYNKRLPANYQLQIKALSAQKRGKNSDINRLLEIESQQLIDAVPDNNLIIALDRQGREFSSTQLASQLQNWHDDRQDISLLIGGPEGISKNVLSKAHETWSLSKLTLPHPLVRILIAEQIYRAWGILSGHPYHR
ncbi:MAG: 23S rRNA (pseudouridine(1915)-N(3))-methyltransferase RlmH [Gammaproteobacteria bacterium]|nr:23S rRNA (pseudouridine(1915)-N(3))-methyltransferase RlmH [Gammaproteobacteria bacterium]